VLAGLAAAWCEVAVKLNVWTPNPYPATLGKKKQKCEQPGDQQLYAKSI
jgi:hypothetical protein